MNKSVNIYRICVAIVFALYSFILFMCKPFYDHLTLWFCYAFTLIAFGSFIALSFQKGNTSTSMGIFTFKLASIYLPIQVAISIILIAIANLAKVFIKFRVHLFIQIPLLLIFVLIYFIFRGGATVINNNVQAQTVRSAEIKQIALQINMARATKRGVKVKDKLATLAISIKYFDLGAHPELYEIEDILRLQINDLNESLDSNYTDEEILDKISVIEQTVMQRKNLAMQLKRR